MKHIKFPQKTSVLLCLVIFFSCTERLDFNQLEDYKLTPVLTAALTFFKVQPFQFFDEDGNQQNNREEIVDFRLFENIFIRENVIKMVFNAEFKNELDRDVTIEIEFLDDNNNLVYPLETISVNSFDTDPPPYEEEIIIAFEPEILTANRVRINAILGNSVDPLDPNDTREFEFKSSVTLFVESEF